jgi:hypothetical protein
MQVVSGWGAIGTSVPQERRAGAFAAEPLQRRNEKTACEPASPGEFFGGFLVYGVPGTVGEPLKNKGIFGSPYTNKKTT